VALPVGLCCTVGSFLLVGKWWAGNCVEDLSRLRRRARMYWRDRFCSYVLGLTHQLHGSLSSCRRVKSGLEASWNWENIERLPVPRPVLLGSPWSRWGAGWKEG
jgi:hypothetical protein